MTLLSNPVFQTVFSGVLIFVVGQIIVRFLIDPIQEFKKTIGKISYELKFYANVYTAIDIAPETFWDLSKILRELASELEANYNAIPIRDLISFFSLIPSTNKLKEVSKLLITLSNSAGDKEYTIKNAESADKIRENLGIKSLG